jgi:hypothetical protein
MTGKRKREKEQTEREVKRNIMKDYGMKIRKKRRRRCR